MSMTAPSRPLDCSLSVPAYVWLLVIASATSHPDYHQLAEKHIRTKGSSWHYSIRNSSHRIKGSLEHYSRNPSTIGSAEACGFLGPFRFSRNPSLFRDCVRAWGAQTFPQSIFAGAKIDCGNAHVVAGDGQRDESPWLSPAC